MSEPIVTDEEIRDIYYRAKSIADGGQEIIALVRRRLAERIRDLRTADDSMARRAAIVEAARIVETD